MRYCLIHAQEYFSTCPNCASQIAQFNRASKEETERVNIAVEERRLADVVVDAAIDWHRSTMEDSMDAAQVLEDAIEKLWEFRRKMPIVKER